MNLNQLSGQILLSFPHEKLPEDQYSHLKMFRFLPLMKLDSDQYRVKDFGKVFLMHTTSKMGMELLTISLCPFEKTGLPYLLIDIMQMKKKRTVFVEYYNCTGQNLDPEGLKKVHEKYHPVLADYDEKPHWYVGERMPVSLIKGGTEAEDAVLEAMILDSVKAYFALADQAEITDRYMAGLSAFRDRMINEGNPSSGVLKAILKEDGAADFFRKKVMPLE